MQACDMSHRPNNPQESSSATLARLQAAGAHAGAVCTGGLDVIRKEAWPFYRTISGVRLHWVLEEPKGPKAKRRPAHDVLSACRTGGGQRSQRPHKIAARDSLFWHGALPGDRSPYRTPQRHHSAGGRGNRVPSERTSLFFMTLGLELGDTKVYEP